MSKNKLIPQLIILGVCLVAVAVIHWVKPTIAPQTQQSVSDNPENPPVTDDTFSRGHVIQIMREDTRQDYDGAGLLSQKVAMQIDTGEETGKTVSTTYEIPNRDAAQQKLHEGEQIVIGKNISPPPVGTSYYVSDLYRLPAIWWILGVFFLLTVIFGGWRGFMAFVGLGFSLYTIIEFIIPHIVAGQNPLIASVIGTIFIALVSLYLAHGVNKRTTIALVGTLITLGIAVGLSLLFVHAAKIFGIGSEEALYLQYVPTSPINLQGLLLGGIIIGVLGILDDITTAQAAAVEEVHKANPTLGFVALYKSGTSVGREHITSLVNTLVLAYTGASFPLLLLFTIYSRPLWTTMNSELVVEEIIRALVGNMALVLAVPITTLLSAYIFSKEKTKH